jgi:two-component system, OmpR family, response regulator
MNGKGDGEAKLRILLVEDNADTAASLAMLLRMYGHNVEVATDGTTALRMADVRMPDVAILDLGLPGGMDGWQVGRQLTEKAKEKMPLLIAVSGFGQEKDRCRSAEAGIHLHLLKPADPESLERLLERFKGIIGK